MGWHVSVDCPEFFFSWKVIKWRWIIWHIVAKFHKHYDDVEKKSQFSIKFASHRIKLYNCHGNFQKSDIELKIFQFGFWNSSKMSNQMHTSYCVRVCECSTSYTQRILYVRDMIWYDMIFYALARQPHTHTRIRTFMCNQKSHSVDLICLFICFASLELLH